MKRPRYLRFLSLLMFLQAAIFLGYFYLSFNQPTTLTFIQIWVTELNRGNFDLNIPRGLATVFFLTGTWLGLGVASFLIWIGLWRVWAWAWSAAIILEGVVLILSLEAYLNNVVDWRFYTAMVVAVLISFLLNQHETQILYKVIETPVEGPFGK